MKLSHLTLLSAATLALGACSLVDSYNEVETLNTTEAAGSPFTQALAAEYREFANNQLDKHFDYPDALHFARKGLAAAAGEPVLPEPVVDWNIDATNAQALNAARGRIITAYDLGARELKPAIAATVQAKFDCWIEFQEESWREGQNITCRDEFNTALNELEASLPAASTEETIAVLPAKVEPAFNSEVFDIDPTEPMEPENAMYIIFFNWDSSKVTSGAISVLDAVANEVTQSTPATINVVGHADTSGPTDYNQRLALRRAKSAQSYLLEKGIDPSIIMMDAKGETDLLVPTPDNVREPANRRVNISFE